ncbi:MAG: hypothetical protein U0R70_15990 [Solirubrobacteraceae bacterium]
MPDAPASNSERPRKAWHDLDGPLGIGLLGAVLVAAIVLWATSASGSTDLKGAPEKLVDAACFRSEPAEVVELQLRGGVTGGDSRVWAVRCEDGTGARVTSWGAVVPLRAGGDLGRNGGPDGPDGMFGPGGGFGDPR